MKIAIIGSRNFTNKELLEKEIALFTDITTIISGGAKGADSLAADYAKMHNIPLIEIIPNYAQYGKKAPLIRNKQIVANADFIMAFWDGSSKGTKFTIMEAEKNGKPTKIVKFQ